MLVLHRWGPNPPENSSSFILHGIEAHHVSSHSAQDCARLCVPAPAVGAAPQPCQGCVLSSLPIPSHPFPLALRALGPAAQTPLCPSSPANPSPLPRIVFLASKLQRLIFCDRSNLLGKAEVHRESSPLNFPKPLQSIHNVALY